MIKLINKSGWVRAELCLPLILCPVKSRCFASQIVNNITSAWDCYCPLSVHAHYQQDLLSPEAHLLRNPLINDSVFRVVHPEFLVQVARLLGRKVAIQWEAEVAQSDEAPDAISDDDDTRVMSLGDAEGGGRNQLGPARVHVPQEHTNREQVEGNPWGILEQVEFQLVDVTYSHRLHGLIISPEQSELQDAPEVDQIRRWTDEEGLGGTESELLQMNDHEDEEEDTTDDQIQFSAVDGVISVDIPRTLQRDGNMQ